MEVLETVQKGHTLGIIGGEFFTRGIYKGMPICKRIYVLFCFFAICAPSSAQTISEYLILQDIGQYALSKPEKLIPGFQPLGGPRIYNSSGIIAGASHFYQDHADRTYEVMYLGGDGLPSPTVQVTQHAGAESDKWLSHEVERGFRSEDLEAQFEGTIKEIDGNRIFTFLFGTDYRWVSNNVVVYISYSDPQLSKPEPIEIVKAYLAKHPSTITLTDADMKSRAHNEKWIKDEMERRLWLCDKWFMQLQLEKAELKDVLKESVKHMEKFLDYREKYYGVSGEEEKDLLRGYLGQQNGTEIKNKLENLKQWWTENKGNTINL